MADTRHSIASTLKIVLPLAFGGAILYWMYRDFDFAKLRHTLLYGMDWTWMLLSFPFGISAQLFRGWRWQQTLEPMGEKTRRSVAVNSIFLSYAVSLIVPRIGEFARCGVLKRWDGVSFPKALGTVVTERAVDSLLMLVIAALAIMTQLPIFSDFFSKTGTRVDIMFGQFTTAGWTVTIICAIVACTFIYMLLRRMTIYKRLKDTARGLWQGVISLRNVSNVPLFIALTLGIWASYFLHYYLTFFCFDDTQSLGLGCAFVTFVVGSIAVIVPTPNGAGPWHFAVKTMLILYGVAENSALFFVLIVHTVQTALVAMLGIYAWIRLNFIKRKTDIQTNQLNDKPKIRNYHPIHD